MKLFGIDVGYGNSFKDKLYWLINGFMTRMGFIVWGGSPPPPSAPTQTTVTNTNIPDYAQPYVTNMLNAAQAQIYNPSGTGFNPYTPYSGDPRNYVAGFSPLQQQAQSTAANLQTPWAYGPAMGQTMGATRQLGGLGTQMGMTGANYAAQATNPAAVNAYMNPYIQASLAPQLQLANQQYGMAGQQEQSAATGAGAFGGSREALMNSLNAQNQMLAQNQLIGQGYNTAFNQAQQAQQFGAQLGLSGQQAQAQALASQLAGANQLAGLGGQELAAQQSILGSQAQQGALQQQNQQNIINQAVQNYATAQQYPFMQLGTLNSMLRGLPMQQSSTQMYQAPPSTVSQLAGLGTAGIGLAGMANASGVFKADGGVVKAKEGGVMKAAGGIPMKMFSPQQLQQVQQSPTASPFAKLYGAGLQDMDNRIENNPESRHIFDRPLLGQVPPTSIPNETLNPFGSGTTPPTSIPSETLNPGNRVGLGQIATPPALTTMRAAGGGLLAFAEGDVTPPVDDSNFKLSSEKEESKSSSGTPFTLFGYPINKAAKDAEVTGLNWQDKLEKSMPAPKVDTSPNFQAYSDFVNASKPDYNAAAPVVTPQNVTSFLKTQQKPVPTAKPVVKELATKEAAPVAEVKPSDYDEIKSMLMEEFKHPSTKTSEDIKSQLASVNKRMAEREATAGYEALARAGFGIMAGTSPHALVNIGAGAPAGLEAYEKSKAATAEDQNLIDKYTIAGQQADEARHQQVGLNLLKMGEMEQTKKLEIAAKERALQDQNFFKALALQNAQDKTQIMRDKMEGFLTPEQKSTLKTVVEPVQKASELATQGLNTLELMKRHIEKAPDGPIAGHIAMSPYGVLANTEGNAALNELKMLKNSLVVEVPKVTSRLNQSEFNAMVSSLGDVDSPNLTKEKRYERLEAVRQHLQNIINQGQSIQSQWDENKKVSSGLYPQSKPIAP
jgi:hypothetical protein